MATRNTPNPERLHIGGDLRPAEGYNEVKDLADGGSIARGAADRPA